MLPVVNTAVAPRTARGAVRGLLLVPLLLAGSARVGAGVLEPSADETVLAVVTHKGGIASGLAHDHFVVAGGYRLRVAFDAAAPERTELELEAPTTGLVVDDPALAEQWSPRVRELGILDEPFAAVSEKDRGKIRRAMLGGKQLDAERFPHITARLRSVRRAEDGDERFGWLAEVTIGLHGHEIERTIPARYETDDDGVTLEALATLRFTDFGIEPYSAFLGAVKNRDEFHLWVRVRARP